MTTLKKQFNWASQSPYNALSVKEHPDFDIDQLILGRWTKKKSRILAEHTNYLIDQEEKLRGKIRTMHFDTYKDPIKAWLTSFQSFEFMQRKQASISPIVQTYMIFNNFPSCFTQPVLSNDNADVVGLVAISQRPTEKPSINIPKNQKSLFKAFVFYHELTHAIDINRMGTAHPEQKSAITFVMENVADVGACLFLLQQSKQTNQILDLLKQIKDARYQTLVNSKTPDDNEGSLIHFSSLSLQLLEDHAEDIISDPSFKKKTMNGIMNLSRIIVESAGVTQTLYHQIHEHMQSNPQKRISFDALKL